MPGKAKEIPPYEGSKGRAPGGDRRSASEEENVEQVLKEELVFNQQRELEQRHGGGRWPAMSGWSPCVTGHQAMLGRDSGLDAPGCQSWAASSH